MVGFVDSFYKINNENQACLTVGYIIKRFVNFARILQLQVYLVPSLLISSLPLLYFTLS